MSRSDRRRFLRDIALATAGLGLGLSMPRWVGASEDRPFRLLVLGGTRFLGPAIVASARARGWEITLFNRGRSAPEMFADLETLIGDRDGNLKALEGREWDAVIDTSGYVPRLVRDSATLLADRVGHYLFVSTRSVYAALTEVDLDESAPVGRLEDPTVEEVNGETYGPLKALCEEAAEEAMPGRVTVMRPGLIIGPRDRSDRFTYWPVRVARAGEVLAPESPDARVQMIDVRDLADFLVHAAAERVTGTFNTVNRAGAVTMGRMLDASREVSNSGASFTWVSKEFLEENEVAPYSQLPCWLPQEGDWAGFASVNTARAFAAGMKIRPLRETCADTLAWWNAEPQERRDAPMRAGLTAEREAELLALWKSRG